MGVIQNLEALLAGGTDSAALRYGLGSAYLEQGEPAPAVAHLERAVAQDPEYSAAWKLLGRSLAALDRDGEARAAFEQGITVAEQRGDVQAVKEMRVFLRRLD